MTNKYNEGFARSTLLIVLFLGITGFIAGIMMGIITRQQTPAAEPEPTVLQAYPQPRVVADFELYDQHGELYSLNNFQDHWSLVFLGYTHCPDICPTTLATLAQAGAQLSGQLPESMQPQIVFISVDPERDQPEQLQRYVEYFDSGFAAASGDDAQLKALSFQLGAMFNVETHEPGATEYQVDHSAGIFLLNPGAMLHGQFQAPHNADEIVAELKTLILADVKS